MIRHSVLTALALAAGSAALADERVFSFECDTPPGHYSSWTVTTKSPAITLTGTLRINEIRQEKKRVGVVNVYFKGGVDGKSAFGFRAYDADRNGSLFLKLLKPGGHDDFAGKPLKAGNKKIPFRLELSAAGTLRARVGDEERSTELGAFVPRTIDLGCSTGDFSFGDLRIVEKAE
jgi:hypothetical protein